MTNQFVTPRKEGLPDTKMIRRATGMHSKKKEKKRSSSVGNSTDEKPAVSDSTLRDQLLAHNERFKGMINLIPSNFYFNEEGREKIQEHRFAAVVESLSKKGKHSRGKELSEKARLRRVRYDPTVQHTVTDLQETFMQEEENETGNHSKRRKIENIADSNDSNRKKRINDDSDDDDDDDSSLMSSVESMNELQQRLQTKIEALKAKRNASSKPVDWAEKRKMKRKEKKAKQKMKHQIIKGQTTGSVKKTPTSSPAKPIFNEKGKMVFSKFDFSENKNDKRENDKMPTGSKKYKKLLEKAEQHKQKIQELKETDKEQAKLVEDKMSWQNALKKAEGVKVKDNPDLIKKSIKRLEKLKDKSRKTWTERNDRVQQKMKEKQDKRKKNIQSKKQAKIDKKMKKAKKKGRVIPGF